MRLIVILTAALGCGLGWAPGARGGAVPVYREYTREIAFYDDEGHLAGYGGAAPDMLALRELRDAKAQEGMLGKETLLEVSFGHGTTLIRRETPVAGKHTPPAREGGERRRGKKEDPDRNWLAKSLTLPSLGQTSSNAATTAIGGEEEPESGWGWLADELAAAPAADAQALLETASPEEEVQMLSSPEARLNRPGPIPAGKGGAATGEKSGAAAPAAGERADAALWNSPGDVRPEGPDRSAPPAVAEMSQTRQMIADISAEARKDLGPWRGSAGADAPSASLGRADARSPARLPGGWSSAPRADLAAPWGGGRGAAAPSVSFRGVGRNAAALPAPAGAGGWQGTWKSQSGFTPGVPIRFGLPAVAVPAPAPAARETARPQPSSGGYKPAWY